MLIETIVASLVPIGIEGLKKFIDNKAGIAPKTVDDQVKLEQIEIDRLKAVAELDKPYGEPSQWVVDLRASSRYLAAIGVIVGGISMFYIPNMPETALLFAGDAIGVVFGFLFGTRLTKVYK